MTDGYAKFEGATSRYVTSSDVRRIERISQDAYDQLDPPREDTLYDIIPAA